MSRGLSVPYFITIFEMITKEQITGLVNRQMEGTPLFLVDVQVSAGNAIRVLVDSHEGVTIDECVAISRSLNGQLDRDKEDYSLEVSSPGAETPFRVKQQYEKNTGRKVEVTLVDGTRQEGTLKRVSDLSIMLNVEGRELEIGFGEIKRTKAIITFN